MAKGTFPDRELIAKAIKAQLDAQRMRPGPLQLNALKKAAQLRDAADSYHQLFAAERVRQSDNARS